MPKSKEQKKQILRDLSEKIKKSKSIVFANFNAFKVKDNEDLRKELKKGDGEYYVAKKTLFNIAFKNEGLGTINFKELKGRIAAIFGYGDEVSSAKTLDKFSKKLDGKIEFVGGVLENKFIDAEATKALARIPGRKELYAKLAGTLNAPISGFVNALAGNLRNLVGVLDAIKAKKQ